MGLKMDIALGLFAALAAVWLARFCVGVYEGFCEAAVREVAYALGHNVRRQP